MSAAKFRVGQWVRVKPSPATCNEAHIATVAGDSGDGQEALLLDIDGKKGVHAARLLIGREFVEAWVPRPGDRVRVSKFDMYPSYAGTEIVVQVADYSDGRHWPVIGESVAGQSVGRTLGFIREAELEPVFDEPGKPGAFGGPAKYVVTGAVMRSAGALEVPPPVKGVVGNYSDPNLAPWPMAPVSVVKENPRSYTHGKPKHRDYIAHQRLESARAGMAGEWKGRK